MPVFVMALFVIGAIYLIIAGIPIITTWIGIMLIGRRAQLSSDQQVSLGFYFYFIMGAYACLGAVMSGAMEGWELLTLPILFFFWPIGMGFAMLGIASNSAEAWITFGLAYLTTQLIAVIWILKRAREDTL